jgi:HD-GYP domain-containing protein (c-di-GMP phosphodiesterase class II)
MSELPHSRLSAEQDGIRDSGSEFLTRVAALLRVGRTYSAGNQLFTQQLDMLAESARPILRRSGRMMFVAYGGEIFLDEIRIAMTSQGFRLAKTLIEEFRQRGIAGFEVSGEPTVGEWRRFFELFLDAGVASGDGLVAAARERGIEGIQPLLRVLEDPSDSDDCDFGLGRGARAADGEPEKQADSGKAAGASLGAVGGRVSASTAAVLGAAPKLYASTLTGLQSLLTSTTAQRGLELRHARRVVQPIVEAVTSPDPIVLGLAGMIKRDEFTYARNVNACMIATAIGLRLGFDRAALANLSVAALLHGIGRSVTSEPDEIGPAGVVLLARRAAMGETTIRVMRVALEAGSGRATPGRSSVSSQVVCIAAAYSRMVSARAEVGRSTTPCQALGMVVGPLTGGFDPALKLALVETLGFYPPGQLVELDDGTVAMVVAPNRDDLARPVLQPLTGPGRRAIVEGVDWPGGLLPGARAIARALTSSDLSTEDHRAA